MFKYFLSIYVFGILLESNDNLSAYDSLYMVEFLKCDYLLIKYRVMTRLILHHKQKILVFNRWNYFLLIFRTTFFPFT